MRKKKRKLKQVAGKVGRGAFFSLKPLERQRWGKVNLMRKAIAKMDLRENCCMYFFKMGLPPGYEDYKTQVLESSVQKVLGYLSLT